MKKFIALLLSLVLVLGLVACGGETTETTAPVETTPVAGNDTPVETTPVTGEKTSISVVAAQYGQNTAAWWVQFEADFEEAYPDIDLVVDVVSWNDIYTVVNTRLANNDAPDILNIDVFADYQAEGLLLPAEDYISDETYAKFYPAFLEQSVVDGTVWAVPDLASARALYYNVDLLTEAGVEVPTTWAELESACQALLDYYGGDIYPWGIDMTTDEGQAAFAYYIWNNGGDFTDADGNWTLNSAENVEAIEYAISLVNAGYTNTDPATETRYDLQDMFGAGKLAMMIGPNSIPTYISVNNSEVNWAISAIPTNEGKESVSAGVMDRFMCFDNGYTDAEMAAVTTFFDFFYEDTRYSEWVLMEDFLPATSAGGEAMAAANPDAAAWIEIVGSAKFYPTAKAEWADVKQGVIEVEQDALLGGNVQELLDELQADIAG